MGKASRNKQTRRWSTIDPDSGIRQVFTVYIDDAGLREWERDRRGLRAAGYPDRPPEVDSPNARGWTSDGRRATARAVAEASYTLGADRTADSLGTWRSGTPDGEFGIKLNVGRRVDGGYVAHLIAQGSDGDRWEGMAEASTPEELAGHTRVFADLVHSLDLPEPTWISTEALVSEVASAVTVPMAAG